MENSEFIKKIDDKSIQVLNKAMVPENNTFLIHDAEGKLIKTLRPGAMVTGGYECKLIVCPPGFGKEWWCWACRPFPEEK